jgi:hypothetical protein|tara:strand:+ start:402 stop:575 length:174 start_codon:yes stop_codon:yes gene_type:complete
MLSIEELKKIKESLSDFGDIVYNDLDDHSPSVVRNLDESIAAVNKALNGLERVQNVK